MDLLEVSASSGLKTNILHVNNWQLVETIVGKTGPDGRVWMNRHSLGGLYSVRIRVSRPSLTQEYGVSKLMRLCPTYMGGFASVLAGSAVGNPAPRVEASTGLNNHTGRELRVQ